MNRIKLLDCTLRDGGYCNNWEFGEENIYKVLNGLVHAHIDMIECGYVCQKELKKEGRTKYCDFEAVNSYLTFKAVNSIFVIMINFGDYDIEKIPNYSGEGISGIRVCFHKKYRFEAIQYCAKLKEKGYKVFVQAMAVLGYSDEELIDMIYRINKIEPYAFYIVDSFGNMKSKDLQRLYYLVDHNLKNQIVIGFHSHNNMQLAYSNSILIAQMQTDRQIIIDTSVYGMGRGAGNLNTELFVEYLNTNFGGDYLLNPLLNIIDDILNFFYIKNGWGYTLANYLSAKNDAHPNYANYLNDKETLTVEAMEEIFSMMDAEKKYEYDKEYIEKLYDKYMGIGKVYEEHLDDLKSMIGENNVLIIAPGISSNEEKDKIIACSKYENVISIGINFDYPEMNTDYIFLSNLRRYRQLDKSKYRKCIVTSNIPMIDAFLRIEYNRLVNDIDTVKDNAGMMLIQFLISLNVKKIFIAGMDGYSYYSWNNFADFQMNFKTKQQIYESMNVGMVQLLRDYSRHVEIEFVTTPRYIRI